MQNWKEEYILDVVVWINLSSGRGKACPFPNSVAHVVLGSSLKWISTKNVNIRSGERLKNRQLGFTAQRSNTFLMP